MRPRLMMQVTLVMGLISVVMSIYAATHALFDRGSYAQFTRVLSSFSCLTFIATGILAFDGESDIRLESSPLLRALIGALSGGAVALIWGWPTAAFIVAAMFGALLGLIGMILAIYMNIY
ncbi:hypothetical protein [Pseudoduganella sp. RAF53_2]|uniref:hypothetical protein n=1 Tax=unclassified Pseudoduganella TaxID=2637179 RepID=UPI003F9A2ECF